MVVFLYNTSFSVRRNVAAYLGRVSELSYTNGTNEKDKSDEAESRVEGLTAESADNAEAPDWIIAVASIPYDYLIVSFDNLSGVNI